MSRHIFPLTATAQNLQRLCWIRLIALMTQALAIAVATEMLDINLNTSVLYNALLGIFIISLLTYWRSYQNWPITDGEFLFHVIIDVAALTFLLSYSGGSTNPFISYYLIPLTVAAAILPWLHTVVIAALTFSAYSLLMLQQHTPEFMEMTTRTVMNHNDHHSDSLFNLHLIGMWLNFLLSATLITVFIVKMANTLRKQNDALQHHREDDLRNEQILAVATLAAGTAHELGTPLSTMAITLKEISNDYSDNRQLQDDINILNQQVSRCKTILQNLSSTANNIEIQPTIIGVSEYLDKVLSDWKILRPTTDILLTTNLKTGVQIAIDSSLEQAIINCLNNSADASPQKIELTCSNNSTTSITISIRDFGDGIALDNIEHIGKAFYTTKGKGLGLGLFLSQATLERLGGEVKLFNHEIMGTVTEINLPII